MGKCFIVLATALFLVGISCESTQGTIESGSRNAGKTAQSDTSITDTLAYLKSNFVVHKEKYISGNLDNLLKDLPFEVISYKYTNASKNKTISPSITLSFLGSGQTSNVIDGAKRPPLLWVVWEIPVSMDSARKLVLASKGQWLKAERSFYGKQKIKDLGVVNW